jgi:hypothetical protein
MLKINLLKNASQIAAKRVRIMIYLQIPTFEYVEKKIILSANECM